MSQSPINRRTVLRGLGVAMSLPWLEAMAPNTLVRAGARACAALPATAAPLRMAFLFVPNGVEPGSWRPKGLGRDYTLSSALEPLAEHRENFSVLSGLAHRNAKALGDGPGDHARSAACFLTGAHPVKTAGRDIRVGLSVDQVAARAGESETLLPSIELGCEPARQSGSCDSGYSCAYSANISWRTASQPNLKETRPRAVFERLFGLGVNAKESREARGARLARRRSILDAVSADTAQLREALGATDRQRLAEYQDSVRAMERRIQRIEELDDDPEAPNGLVPLPGIPDDYAAHVKLMNDMIVLAFRLDQTRVASFMLANEGSNRKFPNLGIADGHHGLSHHGGDVAKMDKIRAINRFQSELFGDLLGKLQGVQEGEGSLLDHSMILFGSAIADGNRHNHDELPVLLAGGGNGALTPGRHVRYERGTPLSNLFVSMLQTAGIETDRFGDSTGALGEL
jgi:hypothetical protein